MTTLAPKARGEVIPLVSTSSEGVADCLIFAQEYSIRTRLAGLAGALLLGAAGSAIVVQSGAQASALPALFLGFAFAGGLLSTWSPCGYSSLCLLRPVGRTRATPSSSILPPSYCTGAGVRAWGCDSRRRSWAGRRAPGLSQHVFPDARRSRLGRTPLRCPSTRLPARSLSSTSRPSTT